MQNKKCPEWAYESIRAHLKRMGYNKNDMQGRCEDPTGSLVNLWQQIEKENSKQVPDEAFWRTMVYQSFDVTDEEMMEGEKRRFRRLVVPRQVMMYLRHYLLGMTTAGAAAVYGKDHATTIHAIKVVHDLAETDSEFREKTLEVWKKWILYRPLPEKFPVEKMFKQ